MTNSYSRAPIFEAMIDIRVAPQPEIPLLDLADGLRQLSQDYPQRESLFAGRMFFSPEEVPPFGFDEGIRYTSRDEQKTFQARTDGFTVSVSPPYTKWSDLRNEAHKLWMAYKEARKPQEITRVAVRYANRLELPAERNITDFLKLHPSFESQLGANNAFQLRMQFPQPDLEATLLLTQQTLAPDTKSNFQSILLDIDLFRDKIPWKVEDDEEIWEFIERLRDRKNLIFESCITDEMRSLIQ